jgi:hypothetical protein
MVLNQNRGVSLHAAKKPKKPQQQQQQKLPEPIPIPVQDVQVTDTASRKAEAIRRRKGGVASTALSETLGG